MIFASNFVSFWNRPSPHVSKGLPNGKETEHEEGHALHRFQIYERQDLALQIAPQQTRTPGSHQVLLALDDSKSVREERSAHLAFETLALVISTRPFGSKRYSSCSILRDGGCSVSRAKK